VFLNRATLINFGAKIQKINFFSWYQELPNIYLYHSSAGPCESTDHSTMTSTPQKTNKRVSKFPPATSVKKLKFSFGNELEKENIIPQFSLSLPVASESKAAPSTPSKELNFSDPATPSIPLYLLLFFNLHKHVDARISFSYYTYISLRV